MISDLLGGPPEAEAYRGWQRALGSYVEEVPESGARGTFADLDPDTQTMMVDEWATSVALHFEPSDTEAVMLRDLCSDLVGDGKRVLVYLAPVNLAGIADLGMLERERFDANVAALAALVQGTGAEFADLNNPRPLPASAFADINHTTAAGCDVAAKRLLEVADRVGVLP